MSNIVINDLEHNIELDRKSLIELKGGKGGYKGYRNYREKPNKPYIESLKSPSSSGSSTYTGSISASIGIGVFSLPSAHSSSASAFAIG